MQALVESEEGFASLDWTGRRAAECWRTVLRRVHSLGVFQLRKF